MSDKEYRLVENLIRKTLEKKLLWKWAERDEVLSRGDFEVQGTPYKASIKNNKFVLSELLDKAETNQLQHGSPGKIIVLQIIDGNGKLLWEIENDLVDELFESVEYSVEDVEDLLDDLIDDLSY